MPHSNLYRYAHNPVLGIDPYGLHTVNGATWYPGDGSPPTSLGNNGAIDSTFDATTRQQMMDPNFTPNAARYKSVGSPWVFSRRGQAGECEREQSQPGRFLCDYNSMFTAESADQREMAELLVDTVIPQLQFETPRSGRFAYAVQPT
jgi:hypothetical protein